MSVIDEAKAKIKGRSLKLVMPEGEDERIRATCASDFASIGSRLADRVGLVLYTCDLRPSADEAGLTPSSAGRS